MTAKVGPEMRKNNGDKESGSCSYKWEKVQNKKQGEWNGNGNGDKIAQKNASIKIGVGLNQTI